MQPSAIPSIKRNWRLRFAAGVVLLCIFAFIGCDAPRQAIFNAATKKMAERKAKVKQSLYFALTTSTNAEIRAWRDFLEKYPSGQQSPGFVWDESLNKFRGNVSAAGLIEDRYILKIILDFEVTGDFEHTTFTKSQFHFKEVKRVIVPAKGPSEGGVSIYFQPNQKWFGLDEWNQLVESDWNFSVLGITIISNSPIPNIRDIPTPIL